jgi:hypothetical protein
VNSLGEQDESVRASLVRRVWVARCDPTPENRELAVDLWDKAGLVVSPALCLEVLEDVAHPVEVVSRRRPRHWPPYWPGIRVRQGQCSLYC